MLSVVDPSAGMVHFELPCPVCSAKVHVVASSTSHEARWCCLQCRIVGRAPLELAPEVMQAGPRALANA